MDGVAIPRQIKISSKFEDNSIECVRKRLRSNQINHVMYEPSTQGEMGTRYFAGVYEANNPMHVLENQMAKDEPKNYYAFIAKNRQPDHYDTFKEEKKTNKKAKTVNKLHMSEDEKAFLRSIKQMTPGEMFSRLEQLLTRILTKEITVPEKTSDQVQS